MIRSIALCVLFLALLGTSPQANAAAPAPSRPPNIVLIYFDDLGYGDLGCFGASKTRTPHIDQLARDGARFTSFYVAQAVCSASRAALLTGCYPNRIGIHGALDHRARFALHTNETTLARLLKNQGYKTALFGKWHLGHTPASLPPAHGFDEYLGLPYSNDMWPNHPEAKPDTYPPLPLIEGTNVVELMPDQSTLTERYTQRAEQFIAQNHSHPFFLYVAHSMPHVPLFASPTFAGRSGHGLFTDVIEELDASVGRILKKLNEHHLDSQTWVIVTSDNGPWLSYGTHAGSSGGFREGKGTAFEGGVRVPCIMRWPGQIPAGRSVPNPMMTIDLFPTIAHVASAKLPALPIDGRNAWPLISGQPRAQSPQPTYFFYYNQNELHAVRSGPWKLFFPHTARTLGASPGGDRGIPAKYSPLYVGLELYNLDTDPGEKINLAAARPDIVQQLQNSAQHARRSLGDSLTRWPGPDRRPPMALP